MSPGAGFPKDKAFPTVRRDEIDYEGQLAEFGRGIKSLRRSLLVVLLVTGAAALALALAGRTGAATGMLAMMIIPLGTVFVIVEIVVLVRRRSD